MSKTVCFKMLQKGLQASKSAISLDLCHPMFLRLTSSLSKRAIDLRLATLAKRQSRTSLSLAQGLEVKGSEKNAALVRIRQFRNRRVAHFLFDKKPDALPKYADLDLC